MYLHVFWLNDFKFNPNIIEMINNSDNGFNSKEHVFITPHKELYHRIINKYKNNKTLLLKDGIKEINRIGKQYRVIFFHSAPAIYEMLKLKPSVRERIIWRTWGHDVDFSYIGDNIIKRDIKKLLYILWKKEVHSFKGIGIANIVDEINISEKFGNVAFYSLPYSVNSERYNIVEKLQNQIEYKKTNGVVKILVGHSGHIEDNHIAIMELLKKYQSESINIILICSYGDEDYIKKYREYALNNWMEKVTIINDFLDTESFAKLICDIDIAILDSERSYALGTLSYLLAFHKKVYLNGQGILHRALVQEGVPHCLTSDIANQDFETFSKRLEYKKEDVEKFLIKPLYKSVDCWRKVFL